MGDPRGLPIGESVGFGWKTVKTHPLFIIGVTVAAWAIPLIIGGAGQRVLDHGARRALMSLIEFAVSSTLSLGLAKIYLRFCDGEMPIFENLFDGLRRVLVFIGAYIIQTIAVAMGFVLLIVPGVIFLIRLWFVGFVVIDEPTVGPLDAIQRSWDITRGYTLDLFLLFIVLLGVNLLGIICLGVGVLVTIPLSGVALAFIYRRLHPRVAAGQGTPAETLAPPAPPAS